MVHCCLPEPQDEVWFSHMPVEFSQVSSLSRDRQVSISYLTEGIVPTQQDRARWISQWGPEQKIALSRAILSPSLCPLVSMVCIDI